MVMSTERRRARAKKIASAMIAKEPKPVENPSNATIGSALSYYAGECSPADSKKWALEWATDNLPEAVAKLSTIKDTFFSNYGYLCRMVMIGWELDVDYIKEQLIKVSERKQNGKEEKDESIATTRTHSQPKINPLLLFLDENVELILNGFPPETKLDITIGSKRDLAEFKQTLDQLEEETTTRTQRFVTSEGEVLIEEPYQEATRKDLLKYVRTLKQLIAKMAAVTTKVHVPTEKVDKYKVVKNFPYVRSVPDNPDFSGVHPVHILGAKTAFVYDLEKRKLYQYVASTQDGFSIKGKTLYNWSEEKSKVWTIRKPELLIGILKDKVIAKTMKEFISTLTTRPREVSTGRFNDSMVILTA